jgi:hypothetical protein
VHESVVEDGNRGDTEQRAVNGADSAEYAGAAEHDGGDREQFVAGPGVGLRLSEASGVEDRRERGDDSRKRIDEGGVSAHRNSCEARAFSRESNGANRASVGGCMHEDPDPDDHRQERGSLRGQTEPSALAKREEGGGEIGEGVDSMRYRLGQSAKKRVGAKRDDQGRQPQPGDKRGVEGAREGADGECGHAREREREARIPPELSEEDGAQSQERAE